MSENLTPFLSLHLHGARFDAGPGMPVEALTELVAYRDLVAEVARGIFLRDHPGRQRVPKRFMEGFELRIRGIDDGSAVPLLERAWPEEALVSAPDTFDAARDLISAAVAAAGDGRPVPDDFPRTALVQFNRFGTGLLDDESIELRAPGSAAGPLYTQTTRRTLLAARSHYQRDAVRVGWVTEADAERMRFHLRLPDGSSVPAPMDDVMFDEVKRALAPAGEGPQVSVGGVGVFDKHDRLVRFDSVHEVTPGGDDTDDEVIDAVGDAEVDAGSFDGTGEATDPAVMERARALFATLVEGGAPVPRVYPVMDGGIQAEWTIGLREVSVTVEPGGSLYVISVDTASGEANDDTISEGDAADRVLRLLLPVKT